MRHETNSGLVRAGHPDVERDESSKHTTLHRFTANQAPKFLAHLLAKYRIGPQLGPRQCPERVRAPPTARLEASEPKPHLTRSAVP
jgi:hypothetical protein